MDDSQASFQTMCFSAVPAFRTSFKASTGYDTLAEWTWRQLLPVTDLPRRGEYVGVTSRIQSNLSRVLHAHRRIILQEDIQNQASNTTKDALVRLRGAWEKVATAFGGLRRGHDKWLQWENGMMHWTQSVEHGPVKFFEKMPLTSMLSSKRVLQNCLVRCMDAPTYKYCRTRWA